MSTRYMSLCQRCVQHWHPDMLTTYSVGNERCEGCGTVSDLAICATTTTAKDATAKPDHRPIDQQRPLDLD